MLDVPTIGIIGYGFVGKATALLWQLPSISINDPKLPGSFPLPEIAECDLIFICVPTPMKFDGGPQDTSIIRSTLRDLAEELDKQHHEEAIVIVKSTVLPDVLLNIKQDFPWLRLVMSPEFLREKTWRHDAMAPRFHIFGGEYRDTKQVADWCNDFSIAPGIPIYQVSLTAAPLVKYMINTFLAMKVIFMNQWRLVFDRSGAPDSWADVVKAFHADVRVGNSHGAVPGPDGMMGYGGKCFPKDVAAIIHFADRVRRPFSLLAEIQRINHEIRPKRDWLKIDGATSKGKIEDLEDPQEKWDCLGWYMEIGKPWAISGVCSARCPARFKCWKLKKERLAQEED